MFEIKNCAKCGKANDVMRKYCRACGAPLIKMGDEPTPEPVEEIEEAPIEETPSFSEDESFVRPSQVASEQAKMESVEPEPIDVSEEPPTTEEVPMEPEEADIPPPEVMDDERGREVVADILEKVKAAEARTRAEEITEPSEPTIEPPPLEPVEVEEPLIELEIEDPVIDEPEPEPVVVEEPPTPPEPMISTPDADIPAGDERVRILESDINAYNIELDQLRSEFDTLRNHLDEEVGRYRTVVEVKRTRTESIERELNLAKKEHSDANKEYKNAENRRKKELSNAEKRIREVEKRIKKAEESKEKRIEELEKEQRKREEEANRD